MTAKYSIKVCERDKKCMLTHVSYIKFIGGTSVGDDCLEKPTQCSSLMLWVPCTEVQAAGFMCFTCLLDTVLKMGAHTVHKCNSEMGTSQAAHFLCD